MRSSCHSQPASPKTQHGNLPPPLSSHHPELTYSPIAMRKKNPTTKGTQPTFLPPHHSIPAPHHNTKTGDAAKPGAPFSHHCKEAPGTPQCPPCSPPRAGGSTQGCCHPLPPITQPLPLRNGMGGRRQGCAGARCPAPFLVLLPFFLCFLLLQKETDIFGQKAASFGGRRCGKEEVRGVWQL